MAGLEIQIGADSSDLQKKIKEAELALKELSQVKLERIKLGLDTKEINGNIASVKKSLNELKTVSKDTGSAIGGMAPKVANGGNALMQFSRIAQDAPYGIMGIGNNITATVEAFGHLKNSTGSTGGALKALAGSIMGSGGILLAVSLVTTAFTYMAQNGLTVGDVVGKMTGSFDRARKAMQDMNAEVAKNSQAQITEVGAYVSAAKNINLSMSERLLAVKKLQDEYPGYFGNLSKEQILNGNVAGAVREVTKALIAKAKASSLVEKIVDLAEKEEGIQSKINDEILRQVKMSKMTNSEAFETAKIINQVLKGHIAIGDVINKNGTRQQYLNSIQADAILKSNGLLGDLGAELRANVSEQDKYTRSVNNSLASTLKLETAKVGAGKKTTVVGSTPQVSGLGSAITPVGLAETGGKVLQIAKDVQGAEGMITTSMGNINIAFDTSGAYMLESLQKFNESAKEIIEGGIADTFAGLGSAIGGALASGGNVIQAAGSALLAGVGGLLTNLGKMAIQVGVGLSGIKAALKTLNPAVAIGAGVALIALGAVFSSKASALGSSGDVSSSGGRSVSTGASVSSPTSSTGGGGSSSFQGGTVVFEISGQSLIGVLSNTLDKNRRLGGSLSF